ncbi:MAG: hypothetical protein AAF721_16590, partial [Myxococcota bacterium]
MQSLTSAHHIVLTLSLLPLAALAGCGTSTPAPAAGGDETSSGTSGGEGGSETGATSTGGDDNPHAIGQQVPWPTDDWTVVTPEEMGMDSTVLEGAFDYAFADPKHTQGVVVVRGGALVAERYSEGRDETSLAASWSAGKSFVSTLVGI